MTDELRAHALDFAARMLGDRRRVEVGDGALPDDLEAVLLTEVAPTPDQLRKRVERALEAAAAGVPVLVYVSSRDGAGAIDLERALEGVDDAVVFEQWGVEYSLAPDRGALPESIEARPSRPGAPDGLLCVANLEVPMWAEARLDPTSAATDARRALERRLAALRARNLALARSRLGAPVEDRAVSRARLAERRLLFARVREIVNALLSRRRLRG